jgi:hypothetical protein
MLLILPVISLGHAGPPFPLLMDQSHGPYSFSLWTDPDVGTGTFFVIVNSTTGRPIPQDLQIQLGVQPASGRLFEAFYSAVREEVSGQVQYKALVQFDAQELWRVRVRWQSTEGKGEFTTTVEATPPGYGRWEMLLYLMPFIAVGVLWLLAVVNKRSSVRQT